MFEEREIKKMEMFLGKENHFLFLLLNLVHELVHSEQQSGQQRVDQMQTFCKFSLKLKRTKTGTNINFQEFQFHTLVCLAM